MLVPEPDRSQAHKHAHTREPGEDGFVSHGIQLSVDDDNNNDNISGILPMPLAHWLCLGGSPCPASKRSDIETCH
jgi:hypothetical protein